MIIVLAVEVGGSLLKTVIMATSCGLQKIQICRKIYILPDFWNSRISGIQRHPEEIKFI